MSVNITEAAKTKSWREALKPFSKVDVCQLPEYHMAYSKREADSNALMWCYSEGEDYFCYPFLHTQISLITDDNKFIDTEYSDISSIYGYSGPLSTSADSGFLKKAWEAFDVWAKKNKVIAEFTRFSIYANTKLYAHPSSKIEFNRYAAVSYLPDNKEDLMGLLGSKTRNMIRKAIRSGLVSKELDPKEWLSKFRALYDNTMDRNQATFFFMYDDDYFNKLLSMPSNDVKLIGVFKGEEMIASAIAIIYQECALYHLGASKTEYSNLGSGNLCLFFLSQNLIDHGVKFLNLGGGRTTSDDDALYKFKKNNSTHVEDYSIGKRIIDKEGYEVLKRRWLAINTSNNHTNKLIFYR